MPYRRRTQDIDPAEALRLAYHYNQGRTGQYPWIGNPLVNYKKPRTAPKKPPSTIKSDINRRVKDWLIPKSVKKVLATNKAMPYKKLTYRRKGRRGTRPRRRRLNQIPLALPRTKVVRMRLVTRGAIGGTSGAIGTLMLKMNSLNDPSGTIGSGLPLGLDQWAGQYTKYIVLGSQLKARFVPVTQTGPGIVGVHLDDNNTALTSSDHYKELPLTKSKVLTTQKDYGTITMKYSGRRFWHLNNIKDDSEQEAAFSTSPGDPTDIAYAHIFVMDMLTSHTFSCELMVEMDFIVLLTNPVTLAQSSL